MNETNEVEQVSEEVNEEPIEELETPENTELVLPDQVAEEPKKGKIKYNDLGFACRLAVGYSLVNLCFALFLSLVLIVTFIRG